MEATQIKLGLDSLRRQAVEEQFQAYNMDGYDIQDCDGWVYDGQDSYRRTVYAEQLNGPSKRLLFYTTFQPQSTEIQSVGLLGNS